MTVSKPKIDITSSASLESTFGADFHPLNNIHHKNNTPRKQSSMLTIINTKKYGRRLLISPDIINHIGSPNQIQIGINNSGIILGMIAGATPFNLKDIPKKEGHLLRRFSC